MPRAARLDMPGVLQHVIVRGVVDGVSMGKRDELVGGDLKRVLKLAGDEEVIAYDGRILGSTDFVEQLKQEKEIAEKLDTHISLTELIQRVAEFARVDPKELCQRGRKKRYRTQKESFAF